jgi:hypothetical protein
MASAMAEHWATTRTGAVRRALETAIAAEAPEARLALVEATLSAIRPHVRPGWTSEAEDREPYDESGLPR